MRSQLETLPAQIADAQANASSVQSQMQAELNQKTQQYAAQDYQYRIDQQNRQDTETQLAGQIGQKQRELNYLQSRFQQQINGYFDPSQVVSDSDVAQKNAELSNLQRQYQSLKQEDARAAALQASNTRWQEGIDQSEVQSRYQQRTAEANKAAQDLSAQYQKLQKEDDQLRASIASAEDQLSTAG